ncbi:MAG: pantetheine-phosphate adenylyltransferase [Oscillospiraceae bacterium]|jgi:pantetheine-phosphate adenylyltransferase|nr:pantetheine-phosphate adenylyltransferase [Oscillospiraceae bacterium]
MTTAVYPGSFDPVTNGHLEIIRRAAALFDRVVVLVAVNALKTYLFSAAERAALLASCTESLPNVTIDASDRLVALYAEEIGATAIVKGLRAMSDFDSEFQQALTNRQLNPRAETIFLPAGATSMYLSSSMVKQVCALGGDIAAFVPREALPRIVGKIIGNR